MMTLFTFLFLGIALIFALDWIINKNKLPGIPEPPSILIVGHLLNFRGNFAMKFLEWKQSVGPIFQIRVFHYPVLVVNDREILSKICSLPEAAGRVRVGLFAYFAERFGKPLSLKSEGVGMGEGPLYEQQRQFYTKAFRTYGIGRLQTEKSIENEIQDLIKDWKSLDGASFEPGPRIACFAFNSVWTVLGSKRLSTQEASAMSDKVGIVGEMESVWDKLAFLSKKMTIVSSTARQKLDCIQSIVDVGVSVIQEHQKDWNPGQPRDVLDLILDKMQVTEDPESYFHRNHLKNGFMLHEIMFATIDTTTRTLEWFMLHMTQNPELASRLSEEIHRVVGPDSSPTLEDRSRMPFTQACIYETLRMCTTLTLGLPRRALANFEVNGYKVPKGTVILTNLYGMNHDPEVWNEPEVFDPTRFLTADEEPQLDVSVKNKVVAFGVGRRMCLGYNIALDVMFLYATSVFQKFTFQSVNKAGRTDSQGRFGIVNFVPAGFELRANSR